MSHPIPTDETMANYVADALEREAADTRLMPSATHVNIERYQHSSSLNIAIRLDGRTINYRVLVRRIK